MDKKELAKIAHDTESSFWAKQKGYMGTCPKCGDFLFDKGCVHCDYKPSKEEIKKNNK